MTVCVYSCVCVAIHGRLCVCCVFFVSSGSKYILWQAILLGHSVPGYNQLACTLYHESGCIEPHNHRAL
jgi:hypothetical protein